MKVVNIILSILILLLSAAAAVFSYFLFEKRSQFVTGWAKMAGVINQSAAELDKGSGTTLAGKLTPSAMAHENYAKLDSLLPELPKLSKQVIIERDALADALTRISSVIRMKNQAASDKLRNLNTYTAAKDDVVSGVNDVISRRDRTYSNLAAAAQSAVGVRIDREMLLNGDAAAFNGFRSEIARLRTRMNVYEQRLQEIARTFRAPVRRFDANNYRAELDKIRTAVSAYQRNAAKTAGELDAARRTIRSRDSLITSLRNNIGSLKRTVADRDAQIVSFQRAFGLPTTGAGTKPWLPGSAEARAKLEGQVVSVHLDYGYIAVNVGKQSVVQQNIGNRVLEINPNVEPGMSMIVTRKKGKTEEFISRISIVQVGETTSIANIPQDAKPIQVGDTVTVVREEAAPAAKPASQTAKR